MLILNSCRSKVEIDYPCAWDFKVIGTDPARLQEVVAGVMAGRDYLLTPSHHSSSGKYHSLTLEAVVSDEADRNRIYNTLKEHPEIKMVL